MRIQQTKQNFIKTNLSFHFVETIQVCLLVRKGPKLELGHDRIDKRLYTGQLTGPGTGQGLNKRK